MKTHAPLESHLVLAALLVLLAVAIYGPVLQAGFVDFDDPLYVTDNLNSQQGLSFAAVAWELRHMSALNWHPLTMLSHRLDIELFGLQPAWHHATSLLLHVVNSVLLFGILSWLTGSKWPSFFVAGLFAVHPTHVESVAWVAERKDVLSTFFWLVTIAAYAWWTRRGGAGRYLLVLLSHLLGLMSKPMVVTLPVVLLLLDWWPLGRLRGDSRLSAWIVRCVEKLPLLALSAATSLATILAQDEALRSFELIPLRPRAENALVSVVRYLSITLWPERLAAFYPLRLGIPWWKWAMAAAALALVTIVAVRSRRSRPYLAVGWLWYLVTLLPVIGIVQVGDQAMADRYTYVTTIGIYIALVWWVASALRGKWALVAGGAAVLALSARARVQVHVWNNSLALFQNAVDVAPSALAYAGLGVALTDAGRTDEAIGQFRRALELNPRWYNAMAGLGRALRDAGRLEESLHWLEQARAFRPEDANVYCALAITLSDLGREDEAVEKLQAAIKINPKFARAHHGLGTLLDRKGNAAAEALRHYELAIRYNPALVELHSAIGLLLAAEGRFAEARDHFEKALLQNPDRAATHANLALALLQLGDTGGAESHLATALALEPSLAGQGFAETLERLRQQRSGAAANRP